MRRKLRATGVGLSALVVISPLTGMQPAQAASGKLPIVRSTSVVAPTAGSDSLWRALQFARGELCATQPGKGKPTLKQAEATAWSYLDKRDGKARINKLRKAITSEVVARTTAVKAMVDNRPDAALTALLVAHDKAPKDASRLSDVAALLVTVGKPREALAFLAAIPAKSVRTTVGGVDGRAVTDTVAGMAYLDTGQLAKAQASFTAALKRQPDLTQASDALAATAACRNEKSTALIAAAHAIPRYDGLYPKADGGQQAPKVPVGAGATFQPWNVAIPHDVVSLGQMGVTVGTEGRKVNEDNQSQFAALIAQAGAESNAWAAKKSGPLTQAWNRSVVQDIRLVGEQPSVSAPADAAWQAQLQFLTDEGQAVSVGDDDHPSRLYGYVKQLLNQCQDSNDIYTCFDVPCQAAASPAFAALASELATVDGKQIDASKASFQAATSLASLLRDPDLQALEVTQAKIRENLDVGGSTLYMLLITSSDASYYADVCQYGAGPSFGDEDATAKSSGTPGKCPPDYGMSIDLEVVELDVGCGTIGVSVSTPGVVGGFAEVDYGFEKGDVTIFAGAKVGAKVAGIGAEARGGAFVTIDSSGVSDVGIRGQVSGSVSAGALGANVSTSSDISFMPSVELPSG